LDKSAPSKLKAVKAIVIDVPRRGTYPFTEQTFNAGYWPDIVEEGGGLTVRDGWGAGRA
jgi:hypothetical protein